MSTNIIDTMYEENRVLLSLLEESKEISFKNEVENNFKKTFLLSIASFFEHKITDMITNYVINKTKNDGILTSFVKNKAIKRQYHSYFNWDSKNNINQFLGLFGEDFKSLTTQDIRSKGLEECVKAFVEVGSYRNQMVHQNFATFYLEKTADEVYELYKQAFKLMSYLEEKFVA